MGLHCPFAQPGVAFWNGPQQTPLLQHIAPRPQQIGVPLRFVPHWIWFGGHPTHAPLTHACPGGQQALLQHTAPSAQQTNGEPPGPGKLQATVLGGQG